MQKQTQVGKNYPQQRKTMANGMAGTTTTSEEAQLIQTVEMFEVITQSQPQDYQSLEILKEAYAKLGRVQEVVKTSKRIAQAYVTMGQLSSAILEYESILQRYPDDPDILAALGEIESKANSLNAQPALGNAPDSPKAQNQANKSKPTANRAIPTDFDDGRQPMFKAFVDGKVISKTDFEACWEQPDFSAALAKVVDPFIQILANKGILPLEKSLKVISEKARMGYLPLDRYDIDLEVPRGFPADVCRRWCVLPFDRMSKSVLVATANPFNRQAASDLEAVTKQRLLWYLAPPPEIAKALRKVFR